MYDLEHGIPIPPAATHRPAQGERPARRYPLREMQVGESFVITQGLVSAIVKAAKRYGVRVVTRAIGNGKSRVWRVH